MSALPKRYFTPEEYLTLEVKADYKSQYVAGEIYAMSGAQPDHVRIETNILRELSARLLDKPCDVFSSNMRVQSDRAELWTYPDVSALCGPPKFNTAHNPPSLRNPQVIFEVLSPSTEAFDRGDKFSRYRKLESLTDYVLVASELMRVEHFVRQDDNSWSMTEYSQPGDKVPLRPLDCELSLADLYRRVEFPSDLLGE